MLTAILKAVRPHQWVKNLFVAAPVVFARRIGRSARRSARRRPRSPASACCPARSTTQRPGRHREGSRAPDQAPPPDRRRVSSGARGPGALAGGLIAGAAPDQRPGAGLRASSPIALGYLALNIAYSLRLKKHRVRRRRLHLPRLPAAGAGGRVRGRRSRRRAGCWSARWCCRRCWRSASARTSCASGRRRRPQSTARCWATTTRGCWRAALVLGVATPLAYFVYTRTQHTDELFGGGTWCSRCRSSRSASIASSASSAGPTPTRAPPIRCSTTPAFVVNLISTPPPSSRSSLLRALACPPRTRSRDTW